MNDIAQEADTGASQTDSTVDSMSTQGARQIYEREAHIVVDYSHLDDDYKDVCLPLYLCPLYHRPLFRIHFFTMFVMFSAICPLASHSVSGSGFFRT